MAGRASNRFTPATSRATYFRSVTSAGSISTHTGHRTRLAIALAVPCALFLTVTLAMSLRTPALSSNDERDHVQYALYIQAYNTLPLISVQNGNESHQPPLYYISLAVWMKVLGMQPFTTSLPAEPASAATTDFGGFTHVYTTAAERQMAVDVHLLRLPSVGYGMIVVLTSFGSAWVLTKRLSLASAAASAVGLWPKFDVVSAAVTNESLNFALCALALLALLLWLRGGGRHLLWAAAVGTFLGLAAVSLRRRQPGDLLAAVIAFAALGGWWFVRNVALYGDPLASAATRAYLSKLVAGLVRPVPSLDPSVLGYSAHQLVNSVWYDGWGNQIILPWSLNVGVSLLGLVFLARGAWIVWRHWGDPGSFAVSPSALALALAAAGSVVSWVLIIRETTQAQGRYLLVAVTAWSILLVAGTDRFQAIPAAARRALVWLWPAIFAGLDAYVFASYLIPHGGS